MTKLFSKLFLQLKTQVKLSPLLTSDSKSLRNWDTYFLCIKKSSDLQNSD